MDAPNDRIKVLDTPAEQPCDRNDRRATMGASSPTALEATVAWDPIQVMEAATHENCTILVHDEHPDGNRCGLGIVDDRAGNCGHDAGTGALTAVIDTGAPEAREWAIAVFERSRREARPVEHDALDALLPSELTA